MPLDLKTRSQVAAAAIARRHSGGSHGIVRDSARAETLRRSGRFLALRCGTNCLLQLMKFGLERAPAQRKPQQDSTSAVSSSDLGTAAAQNAVCERTSAVVSPVAAEPGRASRW